jgi:hypothetical protein
MKLVLQVERTILTDEDVFSNQRVAFGKTLVKSLPVRASDKDWVPIVNRLLRAPICFDAIRGIG